MFALCAGDSYLAQLPWPPGEGGWGEGVPVVPNWVGVAVGLRVREGEGCLPRLPSLWSGGIYRQLFTGAKFGMHHPIETVFWFIAVFWWVRWLKKDLHSSAQASVVYNTLQICTVSGFNVGSSNYNAKEIC